MSLFIKQDQITSNLRNDTETTATQEKRHIPIPRKRNIVKNQQPQIEQKHKNHKYIKLRYSQLEFLPVRRNKLPYNMPDCNETPADTEKECRQNLNTQQGGPIMPRKYLTRCLCSSNNMKIQALLKE